MSTANDTQVGGNHYKTKFEHWDLAHELNLGYFEGQISKYITRHRFKKGQEDVEKALHLCQKLIELAMFKNRLPMHRPASIARMTEYAEANRLMPIEFACVMTICNWGDVSTLQSLHDRIFRLLQQQYPDTGEPGAGYVNQG